MVYTPTLTYIDICIHKYGSKNQGTAHRTKQAVQNIKNDLLLRSIQPRRQLGCINVKQYVCMTVAYIHIHIHIHIHIYI